MAKSEETANVLKIYDGYTLSIDSIIKNANRSKTGPTESQFHWSSPNKDFQITMDLYLNGFEKWMQVSHYKYNTDTQIESYCILITSVKSNLGRGDILYWLCPITLTRCKILHLIGDTGPFRHRSAYSQHVYYPTQLLSKKDRKDYTWQVIEKKIVPELEKQVVKSHYRNKETKLLARISNLKKKAFNYKYEELFKLEYKRPTLTQIKSKFPELRGLRV